MKQIGDDILDTRDIDKMIEDLEVVEVEYLEALEKDDDKTLQDLQLEMDELEELRQFKEELEPYCDWTHGETLIHETYRADYTESLAEDIGAVGKNSTWIVIDWEATARELFDTDYTSALLGGEEYYVRVY